METKELRGLIATRLKEARLMQGFAQSELAERVGCSATWLSHFENGRRMPSIPLLRRIALALRVNTDYLIGIDRKGKAS